MSSAGDLTNLRQIIAQYAVSSAGANAWSTTNPISTSATITGSNVFAAGSITAMNGINLPTTYVGTVTLVAGSNTVTAAGCMPGSYIFLTNQTAANQGMLRVTPGTGSFIIRSSSGTDASVVQWLLINPA